MNEVLEKTQDLIENSIFERKRETIYKHSFIKEDLEKYDKLFDEVLDPEIQRIIKIQQTYSSDIKCVIDSEKIKEFVEKLYLANCPQILKGTLIVQQFYLLYLISILFYRYNERYLKMSINEFINKIYFTNILFICSKHFIQSRRLILRLIKNVYLDIKKNSEDTLNVYYELYKNNETIIKNDIIQLFLTNILPKFNPFDLKNLEDFYTVLFKRIFFFYLKSKTVIINDTNIPVNTRTTEATPLEVQSERFRIYEDAIYLSQIQQICSESSTLNAMNLEFDRFKKLILPNDIQKIFFYQDSKLKQNSKSVRFNLFRLLNDSDNSQLLQIIRTKLPNIYRLLRSVHVLSSNNSFTEDDKLYMRDQFYSQLISQFEHRFDTNMISPIIKNITNNLVNSLTTGEFIDMVTLTQIDITGHKFVNQFKDFLTLIISSIFELNEEFK